MNDNDNRRDKFFPMNHKEMNNCIAFALRNGDRKVAYCKIKDDVYYGGMADTFKEALEWCEKFYSEDNSINLCIGDYSEAVTIWNTKDILHELNIISDEEYDKYLDSIELDD